ncbi:MAG: hypothetical protein ACFFB3_09500 [Candidatus Hodarchaeota archaeon]
MGISLYTIRFFLIKGQDLLAQISLGGSMLLLMVGVIVFAEYLHQLHGKIPWTSTAFYFAAGGSFIALLFQPWKIAYDEEIGYHQSISNVLAVLMVAQIIFLGVISWKTFQSIKEQVQEEIESQGMNISSTGRREELITKKMFLNRIIYCYIIGLILVGLGSLPGVIFLDYLGAIVAFVPQAYILTKDKEILLFLSTKRIKEGLRHLEKQISTVAQQYEDKAQREKQFWIEVVNSLIEKFPELKT